MRILLTIIYCLFSTVLYAGSTQTNTSGSNTAIEGGYTGGATTYESGSTSTTTSTNSSTSNRSNYEDLGPQDRNDYREYFFSQFDLQDFDMLQVKITMYSTNSKKVPLFKNLRILSTI